MEHHPVVIVGAGVAGLTCAWYLQKFGVASTVLEAGPVVGGRVRTDRVEGFLLDHGFQIFLTSYPEALRVLDYQALQLKNFRSGAVIRDGSQLFELRNPLKEPLGAWAALAAPVGSLADKWKVVQMVRQLTRQTDAQLLSQPATTTLDFLRQYGWSERMIRTFFRPFFGGVFLERELSTASNFFQFVFKQFASGEASLPAAGIGAIPQQLASQLPDVRTNTEVLRIAGKTVYLPGGQTLRPSTLVLAVDGVNLAALLGESTARPPEGDFRATTCTYFAAAASPARNRLLTLHTDDASAVHNLCVPSDVAPGYAPEGQALISVSTHGSLTLTDAALAQRIKETLITWYGPAVGTWRHLKTYRIPRALSAYVPGKTAPGALQLGEGLYCCGDYAAYPSLNAAMQTGRQVAELIANRAQ